MHVYYIHFLMLVANYHKYSSLKQHEGIIVSFHDARVWAGVSCVFCSGSHKTEIQGSAELRVPFQASVISFRLQLVADLRQWPPSYWGWLVREELSSCCFQDPLFGFGFLHLDYDVSSFGPLWVCPIWSFLSFLDRLISFLKFGKFLTIISPNILPAHLFLSCLSGSHTCMCWHTGQYSKAPFSFIPQSGWSQMTHLSCLWFFILPSQNCQWAPLVKLSSCLWVFFNSIISISL